jgi:hypothetical protein
MSSTRKTPTYLRLASSSPKEVVEGAGAAEAVEVVEVVAAAGVEDAVVAAVAAAAVRRGERAAGARLEHLRSFQLPVSLSLEWSISAPFIGTPGASIRVLIPPHAPFAKLEMLTAAALLTGPIAALSLLSNHACRGTAVAGRSFAGGMVIACVYSLAHDWTDSVPLIADALTALTVANGRRSGRSPDWIKVKKPDAPAATRIMGMVMRPIGPVAVRIALDQCRREAQKCLDEAAKAQDSTMEANWLALAEQWVNLAERLRDQARWPLPTFHPARR